MKITSPRRVAHWSRILFLLTIGICGLPRLVCSQDATRTIDQTFTFDERGDAKIDISFQYGAAQWAQWKDQYGDHPDLLMRNLRYQFASAVIDDFSLDKDDLHRQATAKLKLRGLAQYRGDGQFTIELPKNMKLVTGSGTDWAFTSSSVVNGELLNQTIRAKLPTNAQNAHFSTGGDYDQLSYSLPTTPTRSKSWLGMGALLLILAGILAGISFVGKSSPAPPPLPQSS
jgi:hypothetical protein